MREISVILYNTALIEKEAIMATENMLELIFGDKYYNIEDLRYNQKLGVMFSKEQFNRFLDLKDQLIDKSEGIMKKIPLKTFNSKHCFYVNGKYLLSLHNEYMDILLSDIELNQSLLFNRNFEDILISRLFSEVEGSLKIEGVPTTRKRILEIHKKKNPTDRNDIIIKNMIQAIEFIIEEKPSFNKENLFRLYNILSKDCLSDDLKLKDGCYYRDDKVYIATFEGANPEIIEECMDSLFSFANDPASIKEHDDLLPYICHYYILYVHPYFDYNGRTARMVSFWLNYINKIPYAPYFMSEAINENKSDYYRALTNTRTTNNDMTYFLGYILEASIKYSLVYKNLEGIKKKLSETGDSLTSAEWNYVKKLIVHRPDDYFNHKMFLDYIGASMTRQGAIKILSKLLDYGILIKGQNKKGDIIYKINPDFITYRYQK